MNTTKAESQLAECNLAALNCSAILFSLTAHDGKPFIPDKRWVDELNYHWAKLQWLLQSHRDPFQTTAIAEAAGVRATSYHRVVTDLTAQYLSKVVSVLGIDAVDKLSDFPTYIETQSLINEAFAVGVEVFSVEYSQSDIDLQAELMFENEAAERRFCDERQAIELQRVSVPSDCSLDDSSLDDSKVKLKLSKEAERLFKAMLRFPLGKNVPYLELVAEDELAWRSPKPSHETCKKRLQALRNKLPKANYYVEAGNHSWKWVKRPE